MLLPKRPRIAKTCETLHRLTHSADRIGVQVIAGSRSVAPTQITEEVRAFGRQSPPPPFTPDAGTRDQATGLVEDAVPSWVAARSVSAPALFGGHRQTRRSVSTVPIPLDRPPWVLPKGLLIALGKTQ